MAPDLCEECGGLLQGLSAKAAAMTTSSHTTIQIGNKTLRNMNSVHHV